MKIKQITNPYLKLLAKSNKELGIKEKKPLLQYPLSLIKASRLRVLSKIKGFLSMILNPLKTAPISILFVIFLIIMVLTVLVANHQRMKYFSNVLVKAYPEISVVPATPEGKPLYPSIIDKVLGEFNAINNVGYLVIFMVFFIEFLKSVEYGFIPRKPQVWRR